MVGMRPQRNGTLVVAQHVGKLGRSPQRGMDVALDLAGRDRTSRQLAVRVEDRVPGVLPALLVEAERRATLVLDEAVTIEIGGSLDPGQRPFDMRPQLLHEGAISGLA